MIFPLFTTITILGAFICLYMKITQKKVNSIDERFWERERLANQTRKQPLDSLSYITIPLDSLPFTEESSDEDLLEYERIITGLANQKIVNLTGISNTDLKLTYGVANITVLSEYDQNYTVLIRTLHAWGNKLYELGRKEEAQIVLEYAVSCKSDIKGTYTLLADIYVELHDGDKIDALIEAAETLNSLNKNVILSKLREKSVYALLD